MGIQLLIILHFERAIIVTYIKLLKYAVMQLKDNIEKSKMNCVRHLVTVTAWIQY